MNRAASGFLVSILWIFSQSALANEILVIAHGGYNSCGSSIEADDTEPFDMAMSAMFQNSLGQLENAFNGSDIKFIAACLQKDGPPSATSFYRTSSDPENLQEIASGDFGEILKLENIEPNTPIFLIGHSYGAWAMMYLTAMYGHEYNIQGLFTLDAIGPNDCGELDAVFGSSGCFQAPSDLNNELIATNSKLWHNFFQDTDFFLQSSEIEEADTNTTMSYGFGDGHTLINLDERVWSALTSEIIAAVGTDFIN